MRLIDAIVHLQDRLANDGKMYSIWYCPHCGAKMGCDEAEVEHVLSIYT